MPELPETIHYIFDALLFLQNYVTITDVPSEIIQKLSINQINIEIKNYYAEKQPFTFTNIPEKTNTSLEASPIECIDTMVHSQPTDTYANETTETDFNSTLSENRTLFSSSTVNTLIDLEDHGQNENQNNYNNKIADDTTNNTNI